MTPIDILAAYILIGLVVACIALGCPKIGDRGDALDCGLFWPIAILGHIELALRGAASRTKRLWDTVTDWVYRTSDKVAAAMPGNYRIYPA